MTFFICACTVSTDGSFNGPGAGWSLEWTGEFSGCFDGWLVTLVRWGGGGGGGGRSGGDWPLSRETWVSSSKAESSNGVSLPIK